MKSNLFAKSKRKEIIEFVAKEYKTFWRVPSIKEISKKFKIGVENYFRGGIREIYNLAGVKLTSRKGLKILK